MTDLASSRALAARRRHMHRKRIERLATVAYHAAAVTGVLFMAMLILGLLP